MGSSNSKPEEPEQTPTSKGSTVSENASSSTASELECKSHNASYATEVGEDQFLISRAMLDELLEAKKHIPKSTESTTVSTATVNSSEIETKLPITILPTTSSTVAVTPKKKKKRTRPLDKQPVEPEQTSSNENMSTNQNTDIFQCPVCIDTFDVPIVQCRNGHSFCSKCISLSISECPICRGDISDRLRNCSLEALMCKLNPKLPDQQAMNNPTAIKHRAFQCITGNKICSWNGPSQDVLSHFENVHSNQIISSNNFLSMKVNFSRTARDVMLVLVPHRIEPVYLISFVDVKNQNMFWVCRVAAAHGIVSGYSYSIRFSNENGTREQEFNLNCKSMQGKESEIYLMQDCVCLPFSKVATLQNDKGHLTFNVSVSYKPQDKINGLQCVS